MQNTPYETPSEREDRERSEYRWFVSFWTLNVMFYAGFLLYNWIKLHG